MELYSFSFGVPITYALSPMAFCYKSEYRNDLVFKWDLKRRLFVVKDFFWELFMLICGNLIYLNEKFLRTRFLN